MNQGFKVKDSVQRRGLNLWAAKQFRGVLMYATGVGKSRCGVLAAQYLHKQALGSDKALSVLIITPTETIRDHNWRDEFTKWGSESIFNECVEAVCIQTAYKWKGRHFDLVIADEMHNYIGEDTVRSIQFSQFFHNNTYRCILGLSAFIDESRQWSLAKLGIPIVDTVSTQKALKLGLISDFNVYCLGVKLTYGEKLLYEDADKRFNDTFSTFGGDLGEAIKCLKPSYFRIYCLRNDFPYEKVRDHAILCNDAMRERKEILYNAANKLDAVVGISNLFTSLTGIVFSQTVDFADRVTAALGGRCVSFHSKITKKARAENFSLLNDPDSGIDRISAAKALNEGMNVPGCSLAIIASSTASERDWIQRLGRVVRRKEGKVAIIVRLFCKGTQEEKWMTKAQKGYRVKFVASLEELARQEGIETF